MLLPLQFPDQDFEQLGHYGAHCPDSYSFGKKLLAAPAAAAAASATAAAAASAANVDEREQQQMRQMMQQRLEYLKMPAPASEGEMPATRPDTVSYVVINPHYDQLLEPGDIVFLIRPSSLSAEATPLVGQRDMKANELKTNSPSDSYFSAEKLFVPVHVSTTDDQ